jgi:hypothetical protein
MYKHDDVISGDGLQAGLLWFVAIPEGSRPEDL